MSELAQRYAVVQAAREWLGTPHRHRQCVKGAGVDCALLIQRAFVEPGIIEDFDVGFYTHDWHMHRSEELYLGQVERLMHRVDDTEETLAEKMKRPDYHLEPGDLIMVRVGRTYSHGMLVSRWPDVIHAYFPSGIVEEVSLVGTPMARVPSRAYSYWERAA